VLSGNSSGVLRTVQVFLCTFQPLLQSDFIKKYDPMLEQARKIVDKLDDNKVGICAIGHSTWRGGGGHITWGGGAGAHSTWRGKGGTVLGGRKAPGDGGIAGGEGVGPQQNGRRGGPAAGWGGTAFLGGWGRGGGALGEGGRTIQAASDCSIAAGCRRSSRTALPTGKLPFASLLLRLHSSCHASQMIDSIGLGSTVAANRRPGRQD